MSVLDRFYKFLIHGLTEDSCTDWKGCKDQDGYPLFYYNGKTRRANRVVYEMAHGEIPNGLFVCHRCDNPGCLNLSHLFLGTPAENIADARAKGRLCGPRKVDETVEARIIELRKAKTPMSDIAAALGLSLSSLYNYMPNQLKRVGNYRRKI